ncbi:MAG: hypothetical protein LAD29_00750 [Rhodoferax sp.]|nr:hypothetical protein [Rhodoferax sp.]
MQRAILLFVFLILTQVVTACAPVPLLVYAPDVPGAKVIYSSCTFNTHILVDTPMVNNYSAVPALQQQRLPITASLIGQRVVAGNVSFNRHFWLATYIESASAQEVWITLPRFTVNGVLTSVPRIHFRRQTAMAVAVFNC